MITSASHSNAEPSSVPPMIPDMCPSYHLKVPDGQTGFNAYPFLLHSKQTMPWTIFTEGEHIVMDKFGSELQFEPEPPRTEPEIQFRVLKNG